MKNTEYVLQEIGKKLAQIRIENKQTLDDVEFLSGIDSSDIHKYEQGKINLTIRTLINLSLALKVHPKKLFDFTFEIEQES